MSESEDSDIETSDIEDSNTELTEPETELESLQVPSTEDFITEDAIRAFQDILQEKPLMALLYRTESYEVQQEAGSYDHPTATIKSGHTLYIENLEIPDGEVWYQVRFWLDGKEQTGFIEDYYLAYADEDWTAWKKEYYGDSTRYADYSDISAFPGHLPEQPARTEGPASLMDLCPHVHRLGFQHRSRQ